MKAEEGRYHVADDFLAERVNLREKVLAVYLGLDHL